MNTQAPLKKRDYRRPQRTATAADFAFTIPAAGAVNSATFTAPKADKTVVTLKGKYDYDRALTYVQSRLKERGIDIDISGGETAYFSPNQKQGGGDSADGLWRYFKSRVSVDLNNWDQVENLKNVTNKIEAAAAARNAPGAKKICDIDLLMWKVRVWCKRNKVAPSRLARAIDLSPGALRDMMSPSWNPKVDTLRRIEAYMTLFDVAVSRGDRDPDVRIPDVVRYAHEPDPDLGVSYADDDNPVTAQST